MCLSGRYLERIGYLDGVAAATEAGASSVTGHYQGENGHVAVLQVDSTITFGLFATGGGSPEWGPNTGTASGTATLTGGVATWAVNEYGSRCSLTFRFEGQHLKLEQDGSDGACGFGAGVYADGTYARSDSRAPTAGELSSGF